ncbi:MAG: hypothetical protein ABEK59_04545 [Halobacteria archaeon]
MNTGWLLRWTPFLAAAAVFTAASQVVDPYTLVGLPGGFVLVAAVYFVDRDTPAGYVLSAIFAVAAAAFFTLPYRFLLSNGYIAIAAFGFSETGLYLAAFSVTGVSYHGRAVVVSRLADRNLLYISVATGFVLTTSVVAGNIDYGVLDIGIKKRKVLGFILTPVLVLVNFYILGFILDWIHRERIYPEPGIRKLSNYLKHSLLLGIVWVTGSVFYVFLQGGRVPLTGFSYGPYIYFLLVTALFLFTLRILLGVLSVLAKLDAAVMVRWLSKISGALLLFFTAIALSLTVEMSELLPVGFVYVSGLTNFDLSILAATAVFAPLPIVLYAGRTVSRVFAEGDRGLTGLTSTCFLFSGLLLAELGETTLVFVTVAVSIYLWDVVERKTGYVEEIRSTEVPGMAQLRILGIPAMVAGLSVAVASVSLYLSRGFTVVGATDPGVVPILLFVIGVSFLLIRVASKTV